MSKITKKLLALLLVSALSVSMLAGCQSETTTDDATDDGATSEATTDDGGDDAAADGELEVIEFWNGGTEDPSKSQWEYAVNKFNAENADTGYTVNMVATLNDTYKQDLVIAMSSGQAPDMYHTWSGGPMIEYIESGFGVPITDKFEEAGMNDIYMDAAIAQSTYNGEIYAIPVREASVAGIYYNTEIFAELGLEEPATIAELETIADTLLENGYVPFALANSSKWTGSMYFMYFATRHGGLEPFNSAVDGTGSFVNDSFIYAGEKIQEWTEKGYFPEGVNGLSEDDKQSTSMFYSEEAAMKLIGSWDGSTYKNDSEEFYAKVDWFKFPALESNPETADIVVGTVGGNFITFNCEGEKLDAAFQCATYYTDQEYFDMMVEAGNTLPIDGVEYTDPMVQQIADALNESTAVQLWYDQYLPPLVSEAHKNASFKLFDFTATPEEVAQEHQDAMDEYLSQQ